MWLSRGLLIFLIPVIAFSCTPKAKIPVPETPPISEKLPKPVEVEEPKEEPRDALLFNAGELFFSREDFANAGLKFRDLIEHYPTSPLANEAKYKLGICYAKTGRYEDSLAILREALPLSLSPLRKSMIYSIMAENYSGLEDYFETLRWYTKAMEDAEEEAQKGEIWQKSRNWWERIQSW